MDEYVADINKAFKELEDFRSSPDYINGCQVFEKAFEDGNKIEIPMTFDIPTEIAESIKRRREESERMRHISSGPYG